MFFSVSDFSSVLCSFGESPLGGLWNEGERSESSGTTRPAAGGGSANCPVGVRPPGTFKCCLHFPLVFSLLRQGTEAGAPAQGAPAVCASSFNPRTVCSQSVAQHEPRTSSAPNSKRCLNCGSGRKFACIRLSHITLTRHERLPTMKKKPAPVYVGMDVAKATLQVHLNGHQFEFKNDAKGHVQLSKKLAKLTLPHVVCEATGGYERPVVEACHKAKILVSVLNPAHTLAASQAQGKRAKTDPCDAAALTEYGQRFQPEPTAALPPAIRAITELTLCLN